MESPYKGKTGLVRLINAFGYSLEGFRAANGFAGNSRTKIVQQVFSHPSPPPVGEGVGVQVLWV